MRLDRCRDDIRAELELLAQELAQHEPLLRKVRLVAPDRIEISAVAVLLHAFYNGIENIFKRIAADIDETRLTSAGWHRELLRSMTQAVPQRPAMISPDLHATLLRYMAFRHIFRHAYVFQFDWARMRELVENLGDAHTKFRAEINV